MNASSVARRIVRPMPMLASLLMGLASACSSERADPRLPAVVLRERLELIADSAEPIVELPVVEGAHVAVGTPLVIQQRALSEANLAQWRAEAAAAEQRLTQLERGTRSEEVQAASARLAGSQAELESAQRDWERARSLFADGAIGRAELDRQQARRDSARAQRDAAAASARAARVGPRVEEIAAARDALSAARARADAARITSERTSLAAPRRAIVEALPYRLGERPPQGAVIAVLLAEDRPAYARVYVPAPLRTQLQTAARIDVFIDGATSAHRGRLRFLSNDAAFTPYYSLTPDDRSRLAFLAEIELPADARVSVGQGATVSWHANP